MTQGKNNENQKLEVPPPDFHGAALIDANGCEIPITEDMVQEACRKLDPQDKASSQV